MKLLPKIALISSVAFATLSGTTLFAAPEKASNALTPPIIMQGAPVSWAVELNRPETMKSICTTGTSSSPQAVSSAACTALNVLSPTQAGQAYAYDVSRLRRDYKVWNKLPRKVRRLLETYEIVVVRNADVVTTSTR